MPPAALETHAGGVAKRKKPKEKSATVQKRDGKQNRGPARWAGRKWEALGREGEKKKFMLALVSFHIDRVKRGDEMQRVCREG